MSGRQKLVWCMDSPGFGGAEITFLRVLKMAGPDQCCVFHSVHASPKLLHLLCEEKVEARPAFSGGHKLRSLLNGIWRTLGYMRQHPNALFIVWCHHLDSNRWLQFSLALFRARFLLVERIVPADVGAMKNSRLTIPIKRFVAKRADKIILNGNSQTDHYCRMLGISCDRVMVIPNSRPIDEIRQQVDELRRERVVLRSQLGLPPGPVIISVGRLCAQKDQSTVIHALARFNLEPKVNASVVFVGDGEDEKRLKMLASELAPGRAFFAGYQSDPLPWLAAADIFVLPSLMEGLPGAVIEAMAAGLPCVVTDIPGNRELVRHEETGLLVPIQDPESLAKAIQRLLLDSDLARRLATAGFDLVVNQYDERVEKAGWEKIFSTLV